MPAPVVTVFGSAAVARGEFDYEDARLLGRSIAENGWTLCNGGYGGTMEATAQGAVEAGGHTIGVTCRILPGRGEPNPYIRQEVPTFDLMTRVQTLIRVADAYVALPGGTGTLLEMAAVWELANKGLLGTTRALVLLGGFWEPVVTVVSQQMRQHLHPKIVNDVLAAIAVLEDNLKNHPE
jgi:uncharacterized protein (TIGR00730 family)